MFCQIKRTNFLFDMIYAEKYENERPNVTDYKETMNLWFFWWSETESCGLKFTYYIFKI